MVEIHPLSKLPEVLVLKPRKFHDSRGFFMETYRASWLSEYGLEVSFCQDNLSLSGSAGTVRGLHFQRAPHAQGKLIQCLQGKVWDVAVDIRPSSPTFSVWEGVLLTADGTEQIYIPPGFAHGFMTLEDNSLVAYKCTEYYDAESEAAIHYADPDLSIDWPLSDIEISLSDKDQTAMRFQDYKKEATVS